MIMNNYQLFDLLGTNLSVIINLNKIKVHLKYKMRLNHLIIGILEGRKFNIYLKDELYLN